MIKIAIGSLIILIISLSISSCDVFSLGNEENKGETKDSISDDPQKFNIPDDGLVFISIRDGNHNIWVMDTDGADARTLNPNEGYFDWNPSSSYDGKRIVYFRENVGLIVLDEQGEKTIVNYSCSPKNPTWSVDNKIYYTKNNDVGQELIYSINYDGTGETRISPAYSSSYNPMDYNPAVSPDGKTLLFDTNRESNAGAIVKMNLSDNTFLYLTNTSTIVDQDNINPAMQPTWSPDGTKIAFSAYSGNYSEDGKAQIYLMNSDGSNKAKLTSETEANCFNPAWSTDGKKIIFVKDYPDFSHNMEIWIINADGSGEKALTDRNKTFEDMCPCFIKKPR